LVYRKEFRNEYYFLARYELLPSQFLKELFKENSREKINSKGQIIETSEFLKEFTYEYKSLIYSCSYEINTLQDDNDKTYKVILRLNYRNNKEKAAEVFSSVVGKLQSNKKNKFYILTIKDDLTMYFSDRLNRMLNEYEWALRSLILTIFLPFYGKNWTKEINNITKKIKKTEQDKTIESALEELDLVDLEDIFFTKQTKLNEKNYNERLLNNIDKKTKNEIIDIVEENKPRSLWDRTLSKYVLIKEPHDKMTRIRHFRNKLAHNKQFSSNDFKLSQGLLSEVTPKIRELEEKLISDRNNKRNIQIMNETIASIQDYYSDVFYDATSSLRTVAEIFKQYQASLPKITPTLNNQIKSLSNQMESLKPISNQLERISSYYKDISIFGENNIMDDKNNSDNENIEENGDDTGENKENGDGGRNVEDDSDI